ncbi:MAG: pyridoxamine 5'-phosphate oxidase family protein [Deltaproteobacteria bacterium]|jgi:nitroimidazol reductase NimA-like FMN-containing flavoprotein (pyridoxamine 5'-phosphate oxidase superfamily)|nr:pyridoxamine 5'-phosphate oxidase family protein [Deltaproteobacteria bacterium]MBW2540635.1 pyridoxamine 5'-phosphate oxidase family protein [Deltaproteobacteria bacterium]
MRHKGPWSKERIDEFLQETRIPVRLACNGASGHPVLISLWFIPLGEAIWCATQRTARIASMLSRDPRCAFEVSVEQPPYCGVRGRAVAVLHDDRGEEILRKLIDRYLGNSNSALARFLLARADSETAIAIEPQSLISWDFRERMRDAV